MYELQNVCKEIGCMFLKLNKNEIARVKYLQNIWSLEEINFVISNSLYIINVMSSKDDNLI